jgi:predicted HicB family RNase H-like nuclease
LPTKDSSILSLRIRTPLLRKAQAVADKEKITLHAWAVKQIENAVKGGDS